jgi:hypothetical protein
MRSGDEQLNSFYLSFMSINTHPLAQQNGISENSRTDESPATYSMCLPLVYIAALLSRDEISKSSDIWTLDTR